ncbi:MAG: SDR family oxidoreductase [Anaerolineales bacterium]|nr:SDR family oxidoreductase [Anaerolineales bacterium]
MIGKICLVTGATSGIGLEAARGLASAGARVVLVGRDPEKGERVRREILASTGSIRVDYLNANLASQVEIRRLADEFLQAYDRLDVLINNAGAAFMRRKAGPDGIERTFALNHLSYFLLTNLLLETIVESAPARIINVSSSAHHEARIYFDNLDLKDHYWIMRAYGQSKLGNVLFTYELARRLEGSGVTVNAMHPGWVNTNIGRNNGILVRLFLWLISANARTPVEGADTILYLATSPEVEGISGKYFIDKRPVATSALSYDQETARRLWEVSEQLTQP